MAKVRYSKLAATDLYEDSEYIDRDKPEAAYRWIEKIEGVCQTLAANPDNESKPQIKEPRAMPQFHKR